MICCNVPEWKSSIAAQVQLTGNCTLVQPSSAKYKSEVSDVNKARTLKAKTKAKAIT